MMAFASDRTPLATRRNETDVITLIDTDNNGVADGNQFKVVASNLPYIHGITINNNQEKGRISLFRFRKSRLARRNKKG